MNKKVIKKIFFFILFLVVMFIIIAVCSLLRLDYKIAAFLGGGVGALIGFLHRESKNE
ncbi:MAG: hypothetical protein IIT65_01545 [Lachnospiraceae bacterium]|nr:hypothetical protein [Lachnospiraceae bacterium]